MNKTILIESNNSASKLYTNRQLRKGVVGKRNIKKSNSQWRTDLKLGIPINTGDQITISGTQVNLRGEPDASMEFSGSLNSQYDEKNALVDNVTTMEYGYYFTNNKQYNFNLPLARHVIVGGERWWKKDFTFWNGERPAETFATTNTPADNQAGFTAWSSFIRGYPAFAIEGCYKAVESQPAQVKSGNTPPSKTVRNVTRWNVIASNYENKFDPALPPSMGHELSGQGSETSISNGPFSIGHSNEKRLYLLEGMDSFIISDRVNKDEWTVNATKILQSDFIALTTREGFQTPSSVAQDLTEQLHEREGQANNWKDEFSDSSIYLHNAEFFLGKPSDNPATSAFIPYGGYDWSKNTKINKFPVSQVSDRMLKIVKTAGGSLLEKIVDKAPLWNDFIADIPENAGWRGEITDDKGQVAYGCWDQIWNNPDQEFTGNTTFPVYEGRKLFYENLLCGEIGRHNAFITQNEMIAGNSHEISTLIEKIQSKQLHSPDELFRTGNLTDIVYLSMGAKIQYPMIESGWDPASPPANEFGACQFGQQKIVNTDFWGIDGGVFVSPALEEGDPVNRFDTTNRARYKSATHSVVNHESVSAVKQTKNMVYPTNIIATPRSIAQLKKMLWINRKAKNFSNQSENAGAVRDNCKNENINNLNVCELEYYFSDDGASIGANSPNGFADPNEITAKFAVPCPYSCAQTEGLGAPTGFDVVNQAHNPAYYKAHLTKGTPSEPFYYDGSMPVRLNPSLRQGNRNNRLNFKVSWEETFATHIDYSEKDTKQGVYLNPASIFKFTNYDGQEFQHKDWLRPQVPENSLFKDETGRYDLWDEQEPEMDSGVALAVVYYKEFNSTDADIRADITQNYPEVDGGDASSGLNPFRNGIDFPGVPDWAGIKDSFGEEKTEEFKKIFYNTPFLALIMNEGILDEKDPMSQHFLPPMIGENFGISHAFLDSEYSKCVTTQRVNPKAYNTITQALNTSDSNYDSYCSRHNPLYYNLYDYQPYCLIGAEDPNIQFGGSSGRFEIVNFHTSLYLGNGSWNDVAQEDDVASAQAGEKIASLNNKLSWITSLTYSTNLRGATIKNFINSDYTDTGRAFTTVGGVQESKEYIVGDNLLPKQGVLFIEDDDHNSFGTTFFGLPVVPWGELQQDSNEHKVITSQSGIGILSLFVPFADQNLPLYLRNINDKSKNKLHERMSAWYPNTFTDTLFNKMGYEVEQLLPMISNAQSNGFNRSNYNKFIGYDGQNLYDKQVNMVYPFTTNGYVSGPINIEGQNRNWQGFDTIYELAHGNDSTANPLGWGNFPNFMGIMDDRGDTSSTLRKTLPAGSIFEMFSMGGLNYLTGTKVTVESDTLVAQKQPKKFDYSYLVLYSNIIEQQSNFYGSNKILPLPAVGYLSRNYSSSDFFYSFSSDFKYVADRNHIINNFDVEIRLPNGKMANLEDNSSIIFKVIKPAVMPLQLKPPKPPTKKEMTKEEKEQDLYYKSLIS